MIDLLTRLAMLGLYVWVAVRSVRLLHVVGTLPRRRSLRVMGAGTVAPIVFWADVVLTSPTVDGSLAFPAWLSRVAFAWLAITLITLQAFIRDAETVNNGQ